VFEQMSTIALVQHEAPDSVQQEPPVHGPSVEHDSWHTCVKVPQKSPDAQSLVVEQVCCQPAGLPLPPPTHWCEPLQL
jgi:hypothetical protein